ncbi:MAG TPA: hypothetical protein VLK37_09680 [Solirubrobacterales bacterium]|nr:hypothetical protein [Solirubrobacterales bacterium]
MSFAKQFPLSKRGKIMAGLLAAAAAVTMMVSIQASNAQAAGCAGGAICVWYGTFFSGEEVNIFQCGAETWASGELKSAKNHCGVNVRIGWQEGGTTNWKACMNPNGEYANPGRFNRMLPGGC